MTLWGLTETVIVLYFIPVNQNSTITSLSTAKEDGEFALI